MLHLAQIRVVVVTVERSLRPTAVCHFEKWRRWKAGRLRAKGFVVAGPTRCLLYRCLLMKNDVVWGYGVDLT